MSFHIREERESDAEAIDVVHDAAFGGDTESKIVNRLRDTDALVVSLVAEVDSQVCGHIAFSAVSLTGHQEVRAVGLAPVGVLPARQNQGIGKALIRNGLKQCREMDFDFAIVLGSQAYYRQFGFIRAIDKNIQSEFGPEAVDHFGILALHCRRIPEDGGIVRYHMAFDSIP